MGNKNIFFLIMIFAAMTASALAPKETFDQWKTNTQKTKYWKDLKTVPANWNVHDRKGNNSIPCRCGRGHLLRSIASLERQHHEPSTVER